MVGTTVLARIEISFSFLVKFLAITKFLDWKFVLVQVQILVQAESSIGTNTNKNISTS